MNYRSSIVSGVKSTIVSKPLNKEEELIAKEVEFREIIANVDLIKNEAPLNIFFKTFKFQIARNDQKLTEAVDQEMAIFTSIKFQKMIENKEKVDSFIKNIFQILGKKKMKAFRSEMSKKASKIESISEPYKFEMPSNPIYIQKEGKLLKGVLLRLCFCTSDVFGQIKDAKKHDIVKPVSFKNQSICVETKETVEEQLKNVKNKDEGYLKWADKSELQNFKFRLFLIDKTTKKKTFLYVEESQTASLFKNQIVYKRIIDVDPRIKNKIKVLKNLWNIKRSQLFYQNHLKKFLSNVETNNIILQETEFYKVEFKRYLALNFPVLHQSNYNPVNVINIDKAQELSILQDVEEMSEDVKKEFLTLINPKIDEMPDQNQITEQKMRIYLKSPFELIVPPKTSFENIAKDLIEKSEPKCKPSKFANPLSKPNFDLIFSNCKLLLTLDKLIVENILNKESFTQKIAEYDKIVYEVVISATNSPIISKSTSIINNTGLSFITIDFQNSLKIEPSEFQSINVSIINRQTSQIVHESTFSLKLEFDNLSFKNCIFHDIELPIFGKKTQSLLCFSLVLIPRNLETGVCILNQELLLANIRHFPQLIKKSENYHDFTKLFLNEKYTEKVRIKELDFLSFLNFHLPFSIQHLSLQESLFFKSFMVSKFGEFKILLRRLLDHETFPREILLYGIIQSNRIPKLESNLFFDFFARSLELLSFQERLLVHKINFTLKYHHFIQFSPFGSAGVKYQKVKVLEINEAFNNYIQQNQFLNENERQCIYQIVMEVYLTFENNKISGKNYRINFLTEYIPMIAACVVVNLKELPIEYIKTIAINSILSTINISSYSQTNNIIYLDSLAIFLKIIFLNLYPEKYHLLTKFMVQFESKFMRYFANSFASIVPVIYFTIYQDFKEIFQMIFLIKNKQSNFLENLSKIGVQFGGLIDVVFLTHVLIKNYETLSKFKDHSNFDEKLDFFILREASESQKSLLKILEIVDLLYEQDFLFKDFEYHKSNLTSRQESLIPNVTNLTLNIRSLGISSNKIRQVISKWIDKNETFAIRAMSLLNDQKVKTDESSNDSSSHFLADLSLDQINRDIYFEILSKEQLDFHEDEDSSKETISRQTVSFIYLNDLHFQLINSMFFGLESKANLNNIFELKFSDVKDLFLSEFDVKSDITIEIFQDITNIVKSKTIPLLRLLIYIIICRDYDLNGMMDDLIWLAQSITSIFFPDKKNQVLIEAIHVIFEEFFNLSPVTLTPTNIRNSVSQIAGLYTGIKSASIDIGREIINLTNLCTQHFCSNSFLHQKPSLFFGKHFCDDLAKILTELKKSHSLPKKFDFFELCLQIFNRGQLQMHNFAFRVGFDQKTRVICQHLHNIFIEEEFNSRSLVPTSIITHFFKHSSLCLPNNIQPQLLDLAYKNLTIDFVLIHQDIKLTVKTTFEESPYLLNPVTRTAEWSFNVKDQPLENKIEMKMVQISVHVTEYFMPIYQMVALIVQKSKEMLSANDFFPFLRVFTKQFEVLTSSGKTIPKNACLDDIPDLSSASQTVRHLSFNVKFF